MRRFRIAEVGGAAEALVERGPIEIGEGYLIMVEWLGWPLVEPVVVVNCLNECFCVTDRLSIDLSLT